MSVDEHPIDRIQATRARAYKAMRDNGFTFEDGDDEQNNAALDEIIEAATVDLRAQRDAAEAFIHHLVRRLANDPLVAYHFDPITQSVELLAKACDALWGAGEGDDLKADILACLKAKVH